MANKKELSCSRNFWQQQVCSSPSEHYQIQAANVNVKEGARRVLKDRTWPRGAAPGGRVSRPSDTHRPVATPSNVGAPPATVPLAD